MGEANEFDLHSSTLLENIAESKNKIRSIAKSAVLELIKQPLVDSFLKNRAG
jgi:hypothetical protein